MAQAALRLQTFWRSVSQRRKYLIARGIIEARDNSRAMRNRAAFKIQKASKAFLAKIHARKELAMARRAREEAFEARLQAVKVRVPDVFSRLMIVVLSNTEEQLALPSHAGNHCTFFQSRRKNSSRSSVVHTCLLHIPTGRI